MRRAWILILFVAAAGIQQETPALDYTAQDSDRMLGVNVTGALMTAQAVARQMVRLEKPGSIVMIASMSGHIVNIPSVQSAYNSSKAAVAHLCKLCISSESYVNLKVLYLC